VEYKAVEFKADQADADSRIISGYASTWDLDQGNDIIVKGAFAQTLSKNPGRVKMLWQHKMDTPIGKPQLMREDDKGLYVEAYIAKTAKGDEALELMRTGIIDRMSIGFTVTDQDYDEKGVRVIKNVELFEFSAVTWPMNEAAVITGVKSLEAKEIERVLREAGLSRSQAKAIANGGLKCLREADRQYNDVKQLITQLRGTINV
jgi:uncharacterized protein